MTGYTLPTPDSGSWIYHTLQPWEPIRHTMSHHYAAQAGEASSSCGLRIDVNDLYLRLVAFS